MKFSIIFPTYNRAELTKECVSVTLKNTGIVRERVEIIWVDDGSPDKKVHQVMKEFDPDISILKKHNQGTIKTKNIGFVLSTGDWICLIDSDIEMPVGWLAELEKYVNTIHELRAVCFSDVNRSRWGGDFITYNGLKLQQMKVNLMSGAYAFSRDVLDNVGYLDEEFGFYGNNDAEWTVRLEKAKYLYGYIPSVEGLHRGGLGEAGENRKKKDVSLKEGGNLLNRKVKSSRVYYNPYICVKQNEMWDEAVRNGK